MSIEKFYANIAKICEKIGKFAVYLHHVENISHNFVNCRACRGTFECAHHHQGKMEEHARERQSVFGEERDKMCAGAG